MDFIPPLIPQMVENYLRQYNDLLPGKIARTKFCQYVCGLISETKRKNIWSMVAKTVEGNYQGSHHFLADAPWNPDAIAERRLRSLMQDPRTALKSSGWWIQDDTSQLRKPGGTDGVARQYIGNVGKIADGLVFPTTHYVDDEKHIPVRAELYWPKAALERLQKEDPDRWNEEKALLSRRKRDKIDIAIEQMNWIARTVPEPKPNRFLVDAWYGNSPRYLRAIKEMGWEYIAAIKGNRTIFAKMLGDSSHPSRRADEVLKLVKADKFELVSVCRADGSTESVYAASLEVKVKRMPWEQRLVIQVDDPARRDPEKARLFLAYGQCQEAVEVVQAYACRNWVEVFYEEGKDDLGADQAEVRREERLLRHWTLVMVAHTMVQVLRLTRSYDAWTDRPPTRFGEALRCLQDLFRWTFWGEWLSTEKHLNEFVRWFRATRHFAPQNV